MPASPSAESKSRSGLNDDSHRTRRILFSSLGGSIQLYHRRFDSLLVHAYWGAELQLIDRRQLITLGTRPFTVSKPVAGEVADAYFRHWNPPSGSLADTNALPPDASFSPERLALEYPVAGAGDLREAALRVRFAGGSATGSLEYRSYEVLSGIPGPEGLPYVSAPPLPCETLRIELEDPFTRLGVELYYLPIPDLPVILRWVRINNTTGAPISVEQAASASLDFFMDQPDTVTLDGAWGKERHLNRRPASPGIRSVESRGGSSGHRHAPFMAIMAPDATEFHGTVIAASLLYSGNHRHLAEQNRYDFHRFQCGINPNGFSYPIEPGECFDTPAAVLAWSDSGLTGISDAYHPFVRRYLFPEQWRDRDRPIVVNTWEARYFDVNSDNVVELARKGKEIGAEVLVLDDGWFQNRRDDRRSLGDWTPDTTKFPRGLGETVSRIRAMGMDFGLWVEPEMVNPDSELYRRRPDWVLRAAGRDPVLSRHQLVLNLGRPEVVNYLIDVFSGVFSSTPIAYVKWDMNRYIVETDGPDAPHRHILGLYRLWSTLVKRFPHILFEGCAGGGGRFDLGSLACMPQFWTSDQTDAVERQRIQFGSSLLFPPETMGAHVSSVPNHQVGRITPAVTRSLTSLCFNFGFELDLSSESADDIAIYARLSAFYKQYRSIFRTGRFLRLRPSQHRFAATGVHPRDHHAWSVVSDDGRVAAVFYFQTLAEPNDEGRWLKLTGLDKRAVYRDKDRGTEFEAAFLINRGLWIPPALGDYRTAYWILEKVE